MSRPAVPTAEAPSPDSLLDEVVPLLGDAVTGTEDHQNAPAIVVRADAVESALATLREECGFDHCAAVTAQEYRDRYESIYHLRSYDDPTRELSVVVPTPSDAPTQKSGAGVYRTCDWHEREAYDLVGVEYEGHSDLRRILLPETWQGHPLSRAYDQDEPQIVPFRETKRVREVDPGAEGETMLLNMGPHHPSTHGVLHLLVTLDGETVADVDPDIGYIHRCEEQLCQQGTYRHQIMPYPDRWDWGGGGLLNEWAYARVAEDLADIEVPEYAQVVRTMGAELSRVLSHLLAVGTYALDVVGEFTAAFQYAIADRERVQSVLEDLTGQRLMFNYFRLGGVAWDLPEPREEFVAKVRDLLGDLRESLPEYHDLLTGNEVLQTRTVGTGELSAETAKDYGCTGPVARGSGVDYDLRRDDPYGYYDDLEWDVVTEPGGDNFSRILVRLREVEESAKIIAQCLDLLEDWPEDDREIQANVPRTIKPPATPRYTAPSRRQRANSASTCGATGRTRPHGSRSAGPPSRTSRRCPRWPRASSSPTSWRPSAASTPSWARSTGRPTASTAGERIARP